MPEIPWAQAGRLTISTPERPSDAVQFEVLRLFDELRKPLLRYLTTIGVSYLDAEDVVQEVFLALYRHLIRGKPRDNLHGWVFRVARNLGLKHRNRNAPTLDPASEYPIPDASLNPEERAFRSRQYEIIRAVVAALPELDRHCLLLRAEGLRYRDIAKALDVSIGTVAQATSRALGRLARATRRSSPVCQATGRTVDP
jgi:RNA polymerase sigma-70 factor (ECF subfamily)